MNLKRILVVDDEPHLVRSISFILNKSGYEVYTAQDGEEALKRVFECKPELIYLDIMMPKMNGYDVCEKIRTMPEFRDIYIIMLSAKGGEIDKDKAFSSGANEFMSKPFSPMEIVAKTKKYDDEISSLNKTDGR
jgi:two-component system, OmpR family, alkaline phosphatase synthesis response regulator PhoP